MQWIEVMDMMMRINQSTLSAGLLLSLLLAVGFGLPTARAESSDWSPRPRAATQQDVTSQSLLRLLSSQPLNQLERKARAEFDPLWLRKLELDNEILSLEHAAAVCSERSSAKTR
jgi:hypothetical protein